MESIIYHPNSYRKTFTRWLLTAVCLYVITAAVAKEAGKVDKSKLQAAHQEVGKHKARLKPINSKIASLPKEDVFSFKDLNWCTKANKIIRKESLAMKRIGNVIKGLDKDDDLEEEEQKYDINRFQVRIMIM